MKDFLSQDVQMFSGFPLNSAAKTVHYAGTTSARHIADILFPLHQDARLPAEERYALNRDLPPAVREWAETIPRLIKKIREDDWIPPPLILLDFSRQKKSFRLLRAETLCGQIPDGNHRILAYTVLASENPGFHIPAKIGTIRPPILAFSNMITLSLWFLLKPLGFKRFYAQRFSGSSRFAVKRDVSEEFKNWQRTRSVSQ